jgi:Flp pilus assembly protein TadG
MRISLFHHLRTERGQALVEFALVLPVLLLLVLGIVDFGRGISYWNDDNQIAENVARFVAVGTAPEWSNFPTKGSCTQPSGTLASLVTYQACLDSPELSSGHTGNGVTSGASVSVCYPTNAAGQPVRVTITASYKWLPFFGGTGFGTTPLTATATMRLENPISGTWVPASSC